MKGKTNEVEVMGYIPINHLNIGYELNSRNCRDGIGKSKAVRIPFEFKLRIPPPRKVTKIVERDYLGRIISSQHF
ncbi:MAG: hypothetical protein A2Y57_03395 [Candidatus Woykebacteria bacterium RBG_13_40_7b]|uniref:Uncharacterized protein n=1 Tax=Candidatus Woykebacteria bacterium RBG_13_40_7b TaxID=1802594 RepID=A0A1G1W9R2_9BACT|nr:MAG: hypothetical protein A2Y57_03395 [Candidatus Woykebacteria bacterium RBG_13_40_7b]